MKMSAKSTVIHPFQRLQGELAELIATTPAGERLPAEPELATPAGCLARDPARGHALL